MTVLACALLTQVLFTLVLALRLGARRVAALKARQVRMSEIALSQEAWPEDARKAGNNFINQFETPVLFYALVLLALHVGAVSHVMGVLAWLYVLFRVVHAVIHTGSNNVNRRFMAFVGGVIVLAIMAVLLGLKVLFGVTV